MSSYTESMTFLFKKIVPLFLWPTLYEYIKLLHIRLSFQCVELDTVGWVI